MPFRFARPSSLSPVLNPATSITHHFRAEFVNLAEGFRASNTLSHTVGVRLEHRWRFHDGDADRTAGVGINQQEVRHVLTALPGSTGLWSGRAP